MFGTYRSVEGVRVPPYITPIALNAGSIKSQLADQGLSGKMDVLLDSMNGTYRLEPSSTPSDWWQITQRMTSVLASSDCNSFPDRGL